MNFRKWIKGSLRSAFGQLLPLILAASLADAAMLYGIRFFMKIISGESPVSLVHWAFLMILMVLVRGFFLILRGTRSERIFHRWEAEMQGWFVKRLQSLHPRFFHEKENEGKLQSAYDSTHILSLSGEAFMQTLQAVFQLLIFLPVLFWISTPLTAFLFLGIVPILVYMQKKMHAMGRAVDQQLSEVGTLRSSVEDFKILSRSWSSVPEIREVRSKVFSLIRSLQKVSTFVGKKKVMLSQSIEAFAVISVVLVLTFCAWMILQGWMSGTGLILYCSALFLCYKPVKECARMIPQLRMAQNAYQFLLALEKTPSRSRRFHFSDRLELQKMNFCYGTERKPVFSGETKSFIPGKHVLLQGVNGAGKSTLLRLIAGLEEPDSGNIVFPLEFIKDGIFLVSQEIRLPPVYLLQKKLPEKDTLLFHFMESANVQKLFSKTGYSGGEKARLALLWALVSPSKMILLDEPFAFIARRDRSLILSAFLKCAQEKGKWIIMASHELLDFEQLKYFDQVEIFS